LALAVQPLDKRLEFGLVQGLGFRVQGLGHGLRKASLRCINDDDCLKTDLGPQRIPGTRAQGPGFDLTQWRVQGLGFRSGSKPDSTEGSGSRV